MIGVARFPIALFKGKEACGADIAEMVLTTAPLPSFERRYVDIGHGVYTSNNLDPSTSGAEIHTALVAAGRKGDKPVVYVSCSARVPITGASLGVACAMAYIGAPQRASGRELVYTGEITNERFRSSIYPIRYLQTKLNEVHKQHYFLFAPCDTDNRPEPIQVLDKYERQLLDPNEWVQGESIASQKYWGAIVGSLVEICAMIGYTPRRVVDKK